MAMGLSPEECEADAQKILADDFRKIIKPFEPKISSATLKWQAVKKERHVKKESANLSWSKNFQQGNVGFPRKSELTSSQRRVLRNGVRPWSEFGNVRLYGRRLG